MKVSDSLYLNLTECGSIRPTDLALSSSNPLFDIFEAVNSGDADLLTALLGQEISLNDELDKFLLDYKARNISTRLFSWAIPNKKAIDICSNYGPIVEVGAGTGYWAWLLRKQGVSVEALDILPYVNNWCRGS